MYRVCYWKKPHKSTIRSPKSAALEHESISRRKIQEDYEEEEKQRRLEEVDYDDITHVLANQNSAVIRLDYEEGEMISGNSRLPVKPSLIEHVCCKLAGFGAWRTGIPGEVVQNCNCRNV